MVFATRQLQDKCQEQNTDLYSTYVDLTKALTQSVETAFGEIIAKYGCSKRFITIVRQFHDSMHARMQDNRERSIVFPITNGVKQGCVLAPLFSVSCFLWCCLMYLMARIMESTFDTTLTALSSTSEGFKQRPRWKLILSSFCLLMTVHWTLLAKPTCKMMLTSSQWPVTILDQPSAQSDASTTPSRDNDWRC